MDRRLFIGTAAAALVAGAARAETISLERLSQYFNSIQTAEATFRQRNDNGSVSTGKLLMHRPGRMRFDYDEPVDLLVLASGGQIGIFDGASNIGKAERYPLNQTPLNLILERNVNLSDRAMVRQHSFDGVNTSVIVQDPKRRELGYVDLKFADDPVRLVGWRTVDGGGVATELRFENFKLGEQYAPQLFSIKREEDRRFR
ncbi:MAG: outer membrane lipoprotein carrier protein LolA [Pseudomonadota bacterium]